MTTDPFAPGVLLRERYRLLAPLGEGGMAFVWRARDAAHERDVAVKVLRPELAGEPTTERFLREIRITAALQHPNILPLLDSGTLDDGRLYYVMPYVAGESLRERLRGAGALPIREALRLAYEVADALGYAHAEGVVHRDVKPENVLLSRGHALVADFGIAAATQQAAGPRLTRTGVSPGTPLYMAPEQAAGDGPVDARADVYALACVTYEMLTGVPAFPGATGWEVLAAKMRGAVPSARAVRPEVPESVDAALRRALAFAPADRFPDAGAFAAALGEVPTLPDAAGVLAPSAAATADVHVGGRGGRGRRAAALLAVGAVAVAGAFVGVRRLGGDGPLTVREVRQLTDVGTALAAVASPDGRAVAYVADTGGALYVRDTAAGAAPRALLRRSVKGDLIIHVRWRAGMAGPVVDGRLGGVAGFWEVPLAGGPPRLLAAAPMEHLMSVSVWEPWDLAADGTWAVAWKGRVWTGRDPRHVPWDGSPPTEGRLVPLPPHVEQVAAVALSPDGQRVAALAYQAGEALVVVAGTDGAGMRVIPFIWDPGAQLAWLDGRTLAVRAGVPGNGTLYDLARLRFGERLSDGPRIDTTQFGSQGRVDPGMFTALPGGDGLAQISVSMTMRLAWVDPRTGAGLASLALGTSYFPHAACVADGAVVVKPGSPAKLLRYRAGSAEGTVLATREGEISAVVARRDGAAVLVSSLPAGTRSYVGARTTEVELRTGAERDVGLGLAVGYLADGRPVLAQIAPNGRVTLGVSGPGAAVRLPAVPLIEQGSGGMSHSGRWLFVSDSSGVTLHDLAAPAPAPRRVAWGDATPFGVLGDTVLLGGAPASAEVPFGVLRRLDLRTGAVSDAPSSGRVLQPEDVCADGRVLALEFDAMRSDVYLVRLGAGR